MAPEYLEYMTALFEDETEFAMTTIHIYFIEIKS